MTAELAAVLVAAVGFAATLTSLLRLFPQAVRTFRQRHEPAALSGVSLPTQWLTLANSALWLTYGLLLAGPVGPSAVWLIVPHLVNIPLTLVVIVLVVRGLRATPLREAGHR